MAKTKVYLIYKANQLQRIFIPSLDDAEIEHQHVGLDETCTSVSLIDFMASGPNLISRIDSMIKVPV